MRWTLNQKAKNEPKFRFYALHDRVYRMDVLEAAWQHVGEKGKVAGIDGVKAEHILAEENGVGKFLASRHESLTRTGPANPRVGLDRLPKVMAATPFRLIGPGSCPEFTSYRVFHEDNLDVWTPDARYYAKPVR